MKKKLFHIIATPREETSRTLQVSGAFLTEFQQSHPDWVVDELNLAKVTLPSLSMKTVDGKYKLLEGKNLFGEVKELWNDIIQHIERFKATNLYLISTPMWNFNIPYLLKHYIDVIVQPKYLFQYKEDGTVEGLVKDKKMIIATSRGGQYPPGSSLNFQENYLRAIFNFVGISDISMLIAEPMDMGHELQQQRLQQAKENAIQLAKEFNA
jgi:FMN-dependent NADH-azoreductase